MIKLQECLELLNKSKNLNELLEIQKTIFQLEDDIPKQKLIAINRTITAKMKKYEED